MTLRIERDLMVESDYGQFYLRDVAFAWPEVDERRLAAGDYSQVPEVQALGDASTSGRFVGVFQNGFVDVLTPGQHNFHLPLRVELHDAEPAADHDAWDHVVDLDFDLPSGVLCIEASGGGLPQQTVLEAGRFRARIGGRGFTVRGGAPAGGNDTWRLQLWPRTTDSEPALRRKWPGWDGYR
jgi:hypothetical protein